MDQGPIAATRVLFLSLPFDSTRRPHLALSQLREVLSEQSISASIEYANLDFARLIGAQNYTMIAEQYPTAMLLGDALFSESTFSRKIDWASFISKVLLRSERFDSVHLSHLIRILPSFATVATQWVEERCSQLDFKSYDLVGFSTTFNLLPALAFSREIKRRSASTKIVLGGSHCDGVLGPSILKHFPWIDFVCSGESELLLPALIKALGNAEEEFDHLEGLAWRGQKSVSQVGRARSPDLRALPQPHFHDWLTQRRGIQFQDIHAPEFPIETSRGCWFGEKSHCTFCGLNGEGMAFRAKPPNQAYSQIAALSQLGASRIFAVDNIMPQPYFNALLPQLAALHPRAEIFYEVKANLTAAQVQALVKAGVKSVQPGIESLSTPILRLMKKGTTSFHNVRLLKYAAQFGLNLVWNVLYGFPKEAPDEYRTQSSLIPKLLHLQPPLSSGSPVRLDRFSPLYFRSEELGVKNIVPSAAYREIYDLPEDGLREIAVFFEFDGDFPIPPDEYIRPLRRSLETWRDVSGRVALVGLDDGGVFSVLDTRGPQPQQTHHFVGCRRNILILSRDGITEHDLREKLSAESPAMIEQSLHELSDYSLIVLLDGRWLSLIVEYSASDLASLPRALRLPTAALIYANDMKRLRDDQANNDLGDKSLLELASP
ncbi:RiPP maturation radical SAM C-methyltransferase [Bradyrhizobium sp. WYCCWR 12699]|uniref:RiPP maturation radical SAM C-methyltransferase n=1 Tax=Bradyrhizobium sp. WYCCWR 12699 TaxID=3064203 RepID=UPI0028A42C62|nr:RiPP maturation radical SAM C-methyltransferase [Bradyrhizobium sp. WYCCWR 12699]MDT4737229.1 RiPP maturation radical SAM C-methyltransferase [Bradyrhizobium sp. WYCCWR 12699]